MNAFEVRLFARKHRYSHYRISPLTMFTSSSLWFDSDCFCFFSVVMVLFSLAQNLIKLIVRILGIIYFWYDMKYECNVTPRPVFYSMQTLSLHLPNECMLPLIWFCLSLSSSVCNRVAWKLWSGLMCSRFLWCCWALWSFSSTAQSWLVVLHWYWRSPTMDPALISMSKHFFFLFDRGNICKSKCMWQLFWELSTISHTLVDRLC